MERGVASSVIRGVGAETYSCIPDLRVNYFELGAAWQGLTTSCTFVAIHFNIAAISCLNLLIT